VVSTPTKGWLATALVVNKRRHYVDEGECTATNTAAAAAI